MNEFDVRSAGLALSGLKNVVMVFPGTKVTDGVDTGVECLVVMVGKKVPRQE